MFCKEGKQNLARIWVEVLLALCLCVGVSGAGTIRIPRGAEDIFPCYAPDGKLCKVVNYASLSWMPLDGDMEFVGEKAECFYADGKAYLLFQSNVPEQIHDSVFWGGASRCYPDGINCGNMGEDVEIPVRTEYGGLFYCSCKNAVATAKGCRPVEKGFEILVADSNKLLAVSRQALFYYFDAHKNKGMNSFMAWLKKHPRPDTLFLKLPFGLEDGDAVAAGDRFAPKLKFVDFYLRTKKLENRAFKAGQIKSFGDLMGVCKEWGRAHENP